MRWFVGAGAGLLLVACAGPAPQAIPSTDAKPSTGTCTDDIREGLVDTIEGQQRAFSTGDFTRARDFASSGFRSTIDTDTFEAIIRRDFAFLLADPAIEFRDCAVDDGVARIEVRIAGTPSLRMTYRLLREDEVWRIDGAGNPEPEAQIAA